MQKPQDRTLQRIAGVIHARRRRDITLSEAFRNIERIVKEEMVAARRKVA